MGRTDNPGRRLFNRAYDTFCPELPALFAMTVIGAKEDGELVTRGLFVGDTAECFEQAAKLSLEVNFTLLEAEGRTAARADHVHISIRFERYAGKFPPNAATCTATSTLRTLLAACQHTATATPSSAHA